MIETERLILREWRADDRTTYLATCNTPAVTRFLGGPTDDVAIDAAIARIAASQATHGFSFWAVERRSDGAFLGYCGLKVAPDLGSGDQVEIGWRLREDAWGQGYAAEAARACLGWAWAHGIDHVIAMTVPANQPSQRVMQRIGMARVVNGDFSHPALTPDDPLSHHVLYRIDRP